MTALWVLAALALAALIAGIAGCLAPTTAERNRFRGRP